MFNNTLVCRRSASTGDVIPIERRVLSLLYSDVTDNVTSSMSFSPTSTHLLTRQSSVNCYSSPAPGSTTSASFNRRFKDNLSGGVVGGSSTTCRVLPVHKVLGNQPVHKVLENQSVHKVLGNQPAHKVLGALNQHNTVNLDKYSTECATSGRLQTERFR